MNMELRNGWNFFQAFPKNRISWADCRMNCPFSNWLERACHPFKPRPGLTALMPEKHLGFAASQQLDSFLTPSPLRFRFPMQFLGF
jgi:hypothetical protein